MSTESPEIRLIALDVDGTLVDDEKNIPLANVRALEAARDRGIEIAIASGRMVPSIEIMENRLGFDCALIAYNGGKVVGPRKEGRPCIAHNPLPVEIVRIVREFAESEGYLLNYYSEDRLFADRTHEANRLWQVYHGRTGSKYNFVEAEELPADSTTKLILLAEPDEMPPLHARFAETLAGRANILNTDPEYLEFMRFGVDKATALPTLAAHFGFTVENVLAVGDGDNDRGMIECAGVGVAVANAKPGVKAAARATTRRDNNEGAVAEAIAEWVFGGDAPDFWAS